MTHVVINELFTKSSKSLDGAVRGRVLDFITRLQFDPTSPGLDLKKPQGAVDKRVRTARVSDFWRAVLFELPRSAGFVLVSVQPHDDAYTYASKLRMEVNAVTGTLELIDQEAISEAVAAATTMAARPAPAGSGPGAPQPLLAGVSAAKLKAFGMSDEVVDAALAIVDKSAFHALCDVLPDLQGCALLDLAAGKDADDVYADLMGQEPSEKIDTEDIIAALERPTSALQFASGSSDELRAAIEGDLQAWRVWLHPLQRRLAYHDGWNGPFRVTGGAGTGKTVTALHRARHLAERSLAARETGPTVLLATYTVNLAEALWQQLRELAEPSVAAQVEVVNLDRLARKILRSAGVVPAEVKVVGEDDSQVHQAWELAAVGSPWDADFLHDEWLHVVLARGVTDQAGYLTAPRPGRGVALNRPKRLEVWSLIESALQHLTVSGVMTHTQAAGLAANVSASNPDVQFRHVIVDEAQDLHPAHWRLVRSLVPEGPDDLFLVGDAHQRIYGRPLVLSRYGIRTQGRSRRLTVNYRTSEQILRWSVAVMAGVSVDDLEGADDPLVGARSEFTGPVPSLVASAGVGDEDSRTAQQVKEWIGEGYPPDTIAVLSRAKQGVDGAVTALGSAGVPAAVVDRTDTQAAPGKVQVMTMHRAKGLEFRCVAITRLGKQHFPPGWAVAGSDDQRALALAQERALLYVAGSRARERLALFHSGAPSDLLG